MVQHLWVRCYDFLACFSLPLIDIVLRCLAACFKSSREFIFMIIFECIVHCCSSCSSSFWQFREMGYLPQAMVNYLALLGWGDGTENEFFTLEQLGQ